VFFSGRLLYPRQTFAGVRPGVYQRGWLHLGRLWPYSKTLDKAGKASQVQAL